MSKFPPLVALIGALGSGAFAQPAPEGLPEQKPPTLPTIREVSPGIFQVGAVKLDKTARRVSFPVTVNLVEGPLEYLLVTGQGKLHESVLKTEVEPHHLQVAMLLLGAKGSQAAPLTNAPAGGPITQGETGGRNPPLPGEAVTIEVSWTNEGAPQRRRVEELVHHKRARQPMARGPFTFTGSRIWQGKFLAQMDGSIIALITDPDALFNNPREHRDADEAWVVRPQDVPPLGTAMELSITLSAPALRKEGGDRK